MRHLAVLVAIAACGGGGNSATPDAAPDIDAAVDAPSYEACREFNGAAVSVPAEVSGLLAAADVQSPSQCTTVDAPYGIESAGPDSVIRIDGLIVGNAYIVQLQSAADLAFYVSTGCSTPSGPAAAECALFVDASAGTQEVGRFIAQTVSAFVVVDYYASHTPANQSFTIEVYAEACASNAQCTTGMPVCKNGECVDCASSFDCTNALTPRCEESLSTCVAGTDQCTTDGSGEPANDGPAGALALTLDANGTTAINGLICSSPRTEADFFSFEVTTVGDIWNLTLSSTGQRDLRLEVFDATGSELGLSYWEQPEVVRLEYLAIGTYYVKVSDHSATTASSVAYTFSAQRLPGTGCTTRADCASEYRNQLFRSECQAGACVKLDGAGAVPELGYCDSKSDCVTGTSCPSFYFVANADTRGVCARSCSSTADCAALGTSYMCTTYLISNTCVQKCTSDEHCPTALEAQPQGSGPWYRLRCDVSSGRCTP